MVKIILKNLNISWLDLAQIKLYLKNCRNCIPIPQPPSSPLLNARVKSRKRGRKKRLRERPQRRSCNVLLERKSAPFHTQRFSDGDGDVIKNVSLLWMHPRMARLICGGGGGIGGGGSEIAARKKGKNIFKGKEKVVVVGLSFLFFMSCPRGDSELGRQLYGRDSFLLSLPHSTWWN